MTRERDFMTDRTARGMGGSPPRHTPPAITVAGSVVVRAQACPDCETGEARFAMRTVPLGCSGYDERAGNNYPAFPTAVRCRNGDVVVVFFRGNSHNSANGVIASRRSTDGMRTWTTTDVVIASTISGWRTVTTPALSDPDTVTGRIWLSYTDTRDTDFPMRRAMVRYSDDHCVTWSAPVDVGSFGTEHTTSAGPIQHGPDAGMITMPIYTRDLAGTRYTSRILQSTDGAGATWAQRSVLLQDPLLNGAQYEEPVIRRLADGRWMALVRQDIDPNIGTGIIWRVTSADGMLTWATATIAFYGWGWPMFRQLESGRIIAINRQVGSTALAVLRASTDSGLTWTAEEYLADPSFEACRYLYGDILELADGAIGLVHAQDLLEAVGIRSRLEVALLREAGATWARSPVDGALLAQASGYPHDGILSGADIAAWWSAPALDVRAPQLTGSIPVTGWVSCEGDRHRLVEVSWATPPTLSNGGAPSFLGPVVTLTSDDKLLCSGLALVQPFAVLLLVRVTTTSTDKWFFDNGAGGTYLRRASDGTLYMHAGQMLQTAAAIVWPTGLAVIEAVFNGVQSTIRLDGTALVTGQAQTAGLSSLRLGGIAGNNSIAGDVKEIVIMRGLGSIAAVRAALMARAV